MLLGSPQLSGRTAQRRGRTAEKRNGSVRIEPPSTRGRSNSPDSSTDSSRSSEKSNFSPKEYLKNKTAWIGDNWAWPKLKQVIRCAVTAWVSLVLFVISPVEIWMGPASFLILIASFLSPPSDPFIAVVEREILINLFICIAWAWSCLGMKLADLTRNQRNPTATFADVLDGRYIEAAPSVIIGLFIALGSVFLLYVKARQGPGPYLFACIFGCICLDISLTTAVFFPHPYYNIGRSILVPFAMHTCISLISSIVIFPHTISAQFTTRIQGALAPLSSALDMHRDLLLDTPGSETWSDLASTARTTVAKSEAALVSVAACGRLLENDLIYCRFSPEDFRAFQVFTRRLAGRAHGLGTYFALIDPARETFPTQSMPNTPAPGTPTTRSRHHSPVRRDRDSSPERNSTPESGPSTPVVSTGGGVPLTPAHSMVSFAPSNLHHIHPHSHPQSHHHRHSHFSHLLHISLANLSLKSRHRRSEHAVGIFESQRYLNLESKRLFFDPRGEECTLISNGLLQECCDPLLEQCRNATVGIQGWLGTVRTGRLPFFGREQAKKARDDFVQDLAELREELSKRLFEFRYDTRMKVLGPYRPAFETPSSADEEDHSHPDVPPHRHLFRCYVYQYHLMQISEILVEVLDEIARLEKKRPDCTLWTPVKHWFRWSRHEIPENFENDEDDDPDIIQGVHPIDHADLGLPKRRDPDALPPRNVLEVVMNLVYKTVTELWNGNSLFAIKAGIISMVLALPFLLKNSASWSYRNRWVWAVIMGQLTFARFRGDTVFGLFARVIATFAGGCIGLILWYISTGEGTGNAYGLAAACAVCFPFFFFVRLYCPIPPMTNIVAGVTAFLVIGYSYQDAVLPTPASPGHGWNVAWRRFVLVTVGVVAAFFASLLPPTMTLRRYQRRLLSTTSNELGAIYCSIVSYATDTRKPHGEQDIVSSLVATRSKLKRSEVLSTNIIYEFSLRGRWPKTRYQQILELQLAISYSLGHLLSVLKHLEPAWTRAFLRRARLLDPDFQGDVLAVCTMVSTALRTGTPLPQITPCPLLDRFTMKYHGLEVIHRDSEEDFGLPRILSLETLQDEQYLMFCVGIATVFGIMNRLDKLMIAAKEIVGEQYHIHGLGVQVTGVPLTRLSTAQFSPPRGV